MKRFASVFLLFLFALAGGCSTTPTTVVFDSPGQIKKINSIAVFPFVSNRTEAGQIIAAALADHLKKSRFSVINQNRLQHLLEEQRLSLERVSENHRCVIGRLKGVDAIITGTASVRAFGGYTEHVAEATAWMIDVTTGETLLEVNFSSENAGRLKGTTPADQIGKNFAQKISSY